ncbi:hypothetical protein [Shouchella shacheensis]|uniref:hypothetical protein n=1 Tax=Shouchella shacheensis TaxID=1649580 RepID=UPI000740392E|nr:hypothetical protein [Shouchella shacheensis]
MDKQRYYVNLNPISMDEISATRVGDGEMIEYEIDATPEEKKEFETLLRQVNRHDVELGNLFSFRHFDDIAGDTDKNEYQVGMNDVYEKIYQLGTAKTKQIISEIHLTNEDDHEPGI